MIREDSIGSSKKDIKNKYKRLLAVAELFKVVFRLSLLPDLLLPLAFLAECDNPDGSPAVVFGAFVASVGITISSVLVSGLITLLTDIEQTIRVHNYYLKEISVNMKVIVELLDEPASSSSDQNN